MQGRINTSFATYQADLFESGLVAQIGANSFAVWSAIKAHADYQTGLSWPSIRRLMDLTGLASATVQKCLKTLEASNLLRSEVKGKSRYYLARERLDISLGSRVICTVVVDYVPAQLRSKLAKVTASHVVDGAEKVFVSLADGRRFQADVVGLDEAADIGVLRVRTGKAAAVHFPALAPAAMATVRVGQPVLAFGSPLGNSHSVSAGIISAKREDNNFLARDTFLQTDTPITFGNSGGVLVNSQGQAVGVVSYGAESGGVSFLVPIDRALRVAQNLMRGERQALACRAVFIPAKALQGIQS